MPERDLCPAAEMRFDFDKLAKRIGAEPHQETFPDDGLTNPSRYKEICIELSTGRFATLTQTDMRKSVIEIGLEIRDDEFFHEEDLLEVISGIQVDLEYVKRYQNDFTWIPASSNSNG